MTKITKFPEDLDTNTELPDIDSDDLMDDVGIEHDVQHTLLNQAVIELQKKVGKNNSEDKNSLTGMLEYLFQYEITGSATFSKLTNEIEIEGIKSLKLDIGDVIEIYGSTKNDNLYTVEDITDILDDKIIVNYEHRNGNGSLSLEDEAVNCKIKRVCKYWQAPLGLGQSHVNVLNDRTFETVYTNNSNRLITVQIVLATSSGNVPQLRTYSTSDEGKLFSNDADSIVSRLKFQGASSGSSFLSAYINVMPNSFYGVTAFTSTNPELITWIELR